MFERSRMYYLYNKPIDIRKSFNGLSGIVQDKMSRQVVDGSGYIFLNKRRSHLKLLIGILNHLYDKISIHFKLWEIKFIDLEKI
jgi:hypothetical protein